MFSKMEWQSLNIEISNGLSIANYNSDKSDSFRMGLIPTVTENQLLYIQFGLDFPSCCHWAEFECSSSTKWKRHLSILSIVYLRNWETHWSRKTCVTVSVLQEESLYSSECQNGFYVHVWLSHWLPTIL